MNTAKLFLSGIRADGRHGARPGEQDEPQPFVVDLDLEVQVGADEIEGTADYRAIVDAVRSVIERRSFALIESMAAAIADELVAWDRVTRATVVVHKPNAAARLSVDGVAAAAMALRE
jgi:7,8-dihydroneopterin aldolase/epimerase/oxygenase